MPHSMDLRELTYPDGYDEPSDALIDRYQDLVFKNGELCSNCFTQIRSIGELREKRTATGVHRFRAYYERTEHGSQEYDPFASPASRYGQCYCLECGADTHALSDRLDTQTLIDRAKNIAGYLTRQTDADVDARAMGTALHALKAEPDNQGYDSEILAAATCVGLNRADADTDARRATA